MHHAYLDAPDAVLRAIVVFIRGRTKAERAAARRELLAYKLPRGPDASPAESRSRERTHRDDERWAVALAHRHAAFNSEKFGGELRSIPIRISRRMKSRLGHYTWRGAGGECAEIVISRRHIRRHGWDEAFHTLLHEMVHQWQDERGHAVDHGRQFRAKARAVGIAPAACRDVA
ncbi:MAG: SprT-like domain-containing protein [Gemmatimonadaceae bacterium]